MLTRTTELAIHTLVFLTLEGKGRPISPRRIARSLGCSPSYLAKTVGMLARMGILQATRGVNGGVTLAKDPEEIRLLEVVETCQGLLIANYCQKLGSAGGPVCSFHDAMEELHNSMKSVLGKWSLADLVRRPVRVAPGDPPPCKMYFEGCEQKLAP